MRSRYDIEAMLLAKLHEARRAWMDTKQSVVAIINDVPYSDDAERMKTATDAHDSALRAHTVALEEFTAFAIDGAVPDRFKESGV